MNSLLSEFNVRKRELYVKGKDYQQKKTKKIKTTRYGCFFKPSISEDEWVMGESAFLCRKYGMDNGMELPLQIIPMEPKAARTTYLLIGDFTS